MQRLALIAGFLVVLALIAGLLAFALGFFPEAGPEPTEVSPAVAAAAEEKLAGVTERGEEARLSAAELTSLFRYRPQEWSLGTIQSPVVEMAGDTLRLNGRVATDDLPVQEEIAPLRGFLPDTAQIRIEGTVRIGEPGETLLDITGVEVAGMPIPPAIYSRLLGQGATAGSQNGTSDLSLPLPRGVRSARVEGGELILTP